jgi:hypothetical protein
MPIVYLDQNKWIDLARAVKDHDREPEIFRVLEALIQAAKDHSVLFPLTATNLYETQKINDPDRRHHLAWVQATLSQGIVFRGRHRRLEVEVVDALRSAYGLPLASRDPRWFLSNIFFESTLEVDDPRHTTIPLPRVVEIIRQNPQRCLFEYLVATPEDVRKLGVTNFSAGSNTLIEAIEARRQSHAKKSLSMRRRAQGALLVINERDLIYDFITKAQIPDKSANDVLREQARRIVADSPTYNIEREMVLRLEAQHDRRITENDLRDMQTFCAVVAYADIVVAENLFSNLARQANLDKQYKTAVTSKLLDLPRLITASVPTTTGGSTA